MTNKERKTKDLFTYENKDDDFRKAWAEAMTYFYQADENHN